MKQVLLVRQSEHVIAWVSDVDARLGDYCEMQHERYRVSSVYGTHFSLLRPAQIRDHPDPPDPEDE